MRCLLQLIGCRKLLTKQQHYDWGLRALKTVLGSCGSVLKVTQKNMLKDNGTLSNLEKEEEMQLVVQALRLNTLSKLTFSDCARFDSLVRDMFPGIPFTTSGYEDLTSALKESFAELELLCNDNQVRNMADLHSFLLCSCSSSLTAFYKCLLK